MREDQFRRAASEPPQSRRVMAARIESLRFRLGRTRRDFARLLGVTHAAVTRWERGEGLSWDELVHIADTTETSIGWLAAGLTPEDIDAPGGPRDDARRTPGGDDRVRPQSLFSDRAPPEPIATAWNFQMEGPAAPDPPKRAARGRRPSLLFLPLPEVSLALGARAPFYRILGRSTAGDAAETTLNIVLRGRRRIEQLGRVVEGGKGSAALASSVEDGSWFYRPGGRYLSIFLPTRVLKARIPDAEARLLRPIAPDTPSLKLLTAYVSAQMTSQAGLNRDVAASVADVVIDLCVLALGAEGDEKARAESRGVRAAQTYLALAAIDEGAATLGFSVRSVARRLGVEAQEVIDLLAESGISFADEINRRRTDVVRRRLVDPTFANLSIAEVAILTGFPDVKALDRLFEARFGEAASTYRVRG